MSFFQYLIARLLLTIPMIFILATLVFLLLRVMPGDPCLAIHGGRSNKAVLERCREKAGLNEPLLVQYVNYLKGIPTLDFGYSFRSNRPVRDEILSKLPATLELAVFAMLISVLLGLVTGAWGAIRSDRPIDHALRVFNIAAFAMPIFWLGLMFQIVFGIWLGWLPVGGRMDQIADLSFPHPTGFYVLDAILLGDGEKLLLVLKHLFLPSLTLGLVLSGVIGRISRANMLEVLHKEYVQTARAKGLAERRVILKHALRNALIPIVTVIGLQFAILLGGAVLTETVFNWDGLARYLIRSIHARDYNAIQGFIVFFAVFVSLVNLIVDLLYSRLDPRVRY